VSGSEWLNVVATLRKREWDVWVMYLIFSWASAGFATALGLAATS